MKKKKILLAILIIIIAVIVIYSIYIFRNLSVINQIINKEQQYTNLDNFYYKTLTDDKNINDNTTIIEHYKKGSLTKIIAQNGGNEIVQWSDLENEEGINAYPAAKKYKDTEIDSILLFDFPYVLRGLESKDKLVISLISKVGKENINGENCFRIEFAGTRYYISIETGLLVKTVSKRSAIEGEKQEFTVVYKEWRMGNVTDNEVAKPDTTNYTKIEN